MILIQLILLVGVLVVLIKFLTYSDSSKIQAWKKIIMLSITIMAIVFIFSPDLLNGAAHSLGVGRGTDLLLYVLTLVFIFSQLNNYIKDKEEHKKIVLLARKISILEAQHNKQDYRK